MSTILTPPPPSIQQQKYAFVPANLTAPPQLIVDSGSTGHYIYVEIPHHNQNTATSPIIVTIPDGNIVTSTHTCLDDLPNLPPEARQGHIFPQFPGIALLSIGVLHNRGYTAEFSSMSIRI